MASFGDICSASPVPIGEQLGPLTEEIRVKAILADFSVGREVLNRLTSSVFRRTAGSNPLSFHLTEVPDPLPITSQWVKVRTIISGISDLDEALIIHGDTSPLGGYESFPFVPGNENLGIITDAGKDVTGIDIGERVVVNPLLSCTPRGIEPVCRSCASGELSACMNFDKGVVGKGAVIGACKDTGGGWADSFVCHRSQIRTVPQSMESDEAALIPEFARAVQAVLRHLPAPGERVLVVGGGSLGQLTHLALRLMVPDLKPTMVVDNPFEAEVAKRLGAVGVTVSVEPGDMYEQIAELFGGKVRFPEVGRISLEGGADLVYETTGKKRFVEDALRFTAEGRRTVLMNLFEPAGADLTPLWFKRVNVYGSLFSGMATYKGATVNAFDVALALAESSGLPYKDLVTHNYRLEEYKQAFSAIGDRITSKAVKVVFRHVV
ncbi:MAG: alcohol dehydrogenase catalytic domain-containing protein [Pseudomonadota bacterium]